MKLGTVSFTEVFILQGLTESSSFQVLVSLLLNLPNAASFCLIA